MPRHVRNFWIQTRIHGRQSELAGGPVSANGGFRQTIYIRDEGDVAHALEIEGIACGGELRISVKGGSLVYVNGEPQLVVKTKR